MIDWENKAKELSMDVMGLTEHSEKLETENARLRNLANVQQEAIREISKKRTVYRRKYERLAKSKK